MNAKKLLTVGGKLFLLCSLTFSFIKMNGQNTVKYQVYALKYRESAFTIPASSLIMGANPNDSIRPCNMFWLLQNSNGKNILIDVGFVDTVNTQNLTYITPIEALKRINLAPDDISDIIVSHPHTDHIGEIDKFPNATVWIQKNDFMYFVGKAWQKGGNTIGLDKKDVQKLVDINSDGRLNLVDGDDIEILPGIRVYTGSKHSYENQYVLVNSNSDNKKILVASDAVWCYYNLEHLLPSAYSFDPEANVEAMKRMKTLVTNTRYIIPGHDDLVFTRFPEIAKWVVQIK